MNGNHLSGKTCATRTGVSRAGKRSGGGHAAGGSDQSDCSSEQEEDSESSSSSSSSMSFSSSVLTARSTPSNNFTINHMRHTQNTELQLDKFRSEWMCEIEKKRREIESGQSTQRCLVAASFNISANQTADPATTTTTKAPLANHRQRLAVQMYVAATNQEARGNIRVALEMYRRATMLESEVELLVSSTNKQRDAARANRKRMEQNHRPAEEQEEEEGKEQKENYKETSQIDEKQAEENADPIKCDDLYTHIRTALESANQYVSMMGCHGDDALQIPQQQQQQLCLNALPDEILLRIFRCTLDSSNIGGGGDVAEAAVEQRNANSAVTSTGGAGKGGGELDLSSLCALSLVSRRFFLLSRDDALWRCIWRRIYPLPASRQRISSSSSTTVSANLDVTSLNSSPPLSPTSASETVMMLMTTPSFDAMTAAAAAKVGRGGGGGRARWFEACRSAIRPWFRGVYMSRNSYVRAGEPDGRFYQPIHIVTAYRALRFRSDGRVAMATSAGSTPKAALKLLFSAAATANNSNTSNSNGNGNGTSLKTSNEIGLLSGRYHHNEQNANMIECNFEVFTSDQTPKSSSTIIFEIADDLRSRHSRIRRNCKLCWRNYVIKTKSLSYTTKEMITEIPLIEEKFPPLQFCRYSLPY